MPIPHGLPNWQEEDRRRAAVALYADGGIIGKNPSALGDTFAFRLVAADNSVVYEDSGLILPSEFEVTRIGNNLSELLAVLYGFMNLPHGWAGTVYSDSQNTLDVFLTAGRATKAYRRLLSTSFVRTHSKSNGLNANMCCSTVIRPKHS